jgi:L-threonylcarbamoyladenylate synthase
MNTRFITVDYRNAQKHVTQEIVDILKKGGIVGMPTDTVYGLACNGNDVKAVDRMYSVKQRPQIKAFVVQVSDIAQIASYGGQITPKIARVMKEFWPGPLTIILNTPQGKTGFRIPDRGLILSVLSRSDFPVFVTSANISGQKDCVLADEVYKTFNGLIELVIDDKIKTRGIASTVLDCTSEPFNILRTGAIANKLKRHL